MDRKVYEVKIYDADLDENEVFLMYGTCKKNVYEYVVENCAYCFEDIISIKLKRGAKYVS